ncbi:MAG TPA: NAD(+)/NADH kinase [Candidatus Atribacteria bacterium]|nr:NAD(+)/NADH kinase [Candidatus Atribacteria bacterium]
MDKVLSTAHIFIKKKIQKVRDKARELDNFLRSQGINTLIVEGETQIEEKPEVVFVLGGDGTFLSASWLYSPSGVPLLGIDMGGLGFLAEASVENMFQAAEEVIRGRFEVEKRMMAQCHISHRDGKSDSDFALNDVVVYRGPFAQMIRLSTYIDGEFLASFPADGLIVATPTGSSAYSLSAGGPVLLPTLELLVVTPICAHTLYARSIVVDPSSTIEIVLESEKEGTMVTLDGQRGYLIQKEEHITVARSNFSAHLIRVGPKRPFYSLLRSKLSWGMDIRRQVEEC